MRVLICMGIHRSRCYKTRGPDGPWTAEKRTAAWVWYALPRRSFQGSGTAQVSSVQALRYRVGSRRTPALYSTLAARQVCADLRCVDLRYREVRLLEAHDQMSELAELMRHCYHVCDVTSHGQLARGSHRPVIHEHRQVRCAVTLVEIELLTACALILGACGESLHSARLPASPMARRARWAVPFQLLMAVAFIIMAIWTYESDLKVPGYVWRAGGLLLAFDLLFISGTGAYLLTEAALLLQRIRVAQG
jgi:hypothetical protein